MFTTDRSHTEADAGGYATATAPEYDDRFEAVHDFEYPEYAPKPIDPDIAAAIRAAADHAEALRAADAAWSAAHPRFTPGT